MRKPNEKDVAEAGGRLLAAEAEYLAAWGWAPLVRENPGHKSDILWTRSGVTLQQFRAVQLQKVEDAEM